MSDRFYTDGEHSIPTVETALSDDYNGWKNYETWNVALWIQNDEGLYDIAKELDCYKDFMDTIRTKARWGVGSLTYQTPDGVAWNDSGLDIEELDEMIGEL